MEHKVGKTEKGSYLWVVKNYSMLRKQIGVGKSIESEEFTAGGHRWTIVFYPNAVDIDAYNAGYVSLYSFEEREQCSSANFTRDLPASSQGPSIGVWTSKIEKQRQGDETDFSNLLESKKGADVFFRVEKERLCAHKWILAGRSPVFRSLLSGCNKPHEFIITNMDSRIFKAMLWFIYKGNLLEEDGQTFDAHGQCVFESFWGKMLAAANRFGLKSLRRLCESRILESTTLETVAYTLHLADLYGATHLKSACLRFAVKNQAGSFVSIKDYVSTVCRPWHAIGNKPKKE
ncbi:hypothetical protein DH2020_042999 [Rehmannia glutinosa]|uniref:BTB/POZ and MATH domain-containing protein n=1 Tax=Rehmannia glutinosa TaxID=99300 RepID=A0ABR0UL19_REHGL